jgi:glycosyltransferase involved in cell wall biosynthesis
LKKNWEWKLLCKVITLSDTTIVLDKTSYNTLHNAGFNNVVLLPNPVAPRVTELIERAGNVERKERTLLFAGHVIPTKGVYELVEACKQIPNIKLRLIGNIADNIRQDLQNNTGNAPWLDIADECAYEKTITEMLSCDIFVLPTYTEGFPNVILESMACGCAIVTTPVGAIPEMLEEENGKRYGILVAQKNAEELKNGIERLLNDKLLKEECRYNAKRRVNERYNIDAVWSQMLTIWRETAQKTYSK